MLRHLHTGHVQRIRAENASALIFIPHMPQSPDIPEATACASVLRATARCLHDSCSTSFPERDRLPEFLSPATNDKLVPRHSGKRKGRKLRGKKVRFRKNMQCLYLIVLIYYYINLFSCAGYFDQRSFFHYKEKRHKFSTDIVSNRLFFPPCRIQIIIFFT